MKSSTSILLITVILFQVNGHVSQTTTVTSTTGTVPSTGSTIPSIMTTPSLRSLIDPIQTEIDKMIDRLKAYPNLSKQEMEQLKIYKQMLDTLSKVSGSDQIKKAAKDKFNRLQSEIHGVLKSIEARLPESSTRTVTSTVTPTTVGSTLSAGTGTEPGTDHTATKELPKSTTKSDFQHLIEEYEAKIQEVLAKLGKSPLSKSEREQLENYKQMLKTLSAAHKSNSTSMKNAAEKRFDDLKNEIDQLLDNIEQRLPKPSTPLYKS